jgi:hypothetical protein
MFYVIDRNLEIINKASAAHVEEVAELFYPGADVKYLGEYKVKVLVSSPVVIAQNEDADYVTEEDFN